VKYKKTFSQRKSFSFLNYVILTETITTIIIW